MLINSIRIYREGGWWGTDQVLIEATVFMGISEIRSYSLWTTTPYMEWKVPLNTDTFELLDSPVNGSSIVIAFTDVNYPGTEIIIEAGGKVLKYEAVKQKETQTFTVQLELLGDVTGDLKISSTDALFIAQYLAGVRELDELQRRKADVDGDGIITANDSEQIAYCLAGDLRKDQDVCDLLGRPIAFYLPLPVKEYQPPKPPPEQPPVKKKIPVWPFAVGGGLLGLVLLAKRRRK